GVSDHIFRSWHPRTRPADTRPPEGIRWDGLQVLGVTAGGEEDDTGWVEFRASWSTPPPERQHGIQHETWPSTSRPRATTSPTGRPWRPPGPWARARANAPAGSCTTTPSNGPRTMNGRSTRWSRRPRTSPPAPAR